MCHYGDYGAGEKRLHVLMQKVHTIRNDKNKKRKEAHAQSLQEQAKRFAKKAESLDEVPPSCLSSHQRVSSHERRGSSRLVSSHALGLVSSHHLTLVYSLITHALVPVFFGGFDALCLGWFVVAVPQDGEEEALQKRRQRGC